MDFTVIYVCQDNTTKETKFINKEFINGKGYYPKNNPEDIKELLDALGYDEDVALFDLTILDVCEVLDEHGKTLWNER